MAKIPAIAWTVTTGLSFLILADVGADAQTSSAAGPGFLSSDKVISALVSGIVSGFVAIVGGGVSLYLAWRTARNTVILEHAKRQNELALTISELVSSTDLEVRKAAMRRFAVGIVKIIEPKTHPERGKVYFIPMNSRVTVGRSDDNDIIIKEERGWLSRWHCGFISDQHNVWIDDYKSHNGTRVNGVDIVESTMLKSGDDIEIGPYKLHFRAIRGNTILSQ